MFSRSSLLILLVTLIVNSVQAFDPNNQIIWENTLQYSWQARVPGTQRHIGVGIYNRDFINAGDTALQLAADYYLHNRLYHLRIEHVFECMLKDAKNVSAWLDQLQKNYRGNITAFKKYIRSSQQLIAYNPFKKKLVGPLATTVTISQLSTALKQQFLSDTFDTNSLKRFQWKNNQLEQIPFPAPLSIVPLLGIAGSFLASPLMSVLFAPWFIAKGTVSLAADYIGSHHIHRGIRSAGQVVASRLFPNHPNAVTFLFSKPCSILVQTAFLAYALKYMDSWYDDLWIEYLAKNHAKLRTILQEYESTHDQVLRASPDRKLGLTKSLEESKESLMSFIKAGHAIRSIIPRTSFATWSTAKSALLDKPVKLLCLAVGTYATYKGYQWYQQLQQPT